MHRHIEPTTQSHPRTYAKDKSIPVSSHLKDPIKFLSKVRNLDLSSPALMLLYLDLTFSRGLTFYFP